MIIPDPDIVNLELRMLGTFISAIAYGIVTVLSGRCTLLLHKKRAIYSNRMRNFLFIYVTVMFLFSTLAIIQSIWGNMIITFHPEFQEHHSLQSQNGIRLYALVENFTSTLPLTIWGADGFMIWRCAVFYQDVTRGHRILVFVLLSLVAILSLGCGAMTFLALFDIFSSTVSVFLVPIVSTLVNIILGSLIILRLVHHQRHVRKVLGAEYGSPYSKVITMCVESSALIVIFGAAYIVLAFMRPTGSVYIPLLLLPHIFVISPLLIIYRVAKGCAMTTTLLPSEQEMAQIRFNNPPSSQEGDITV